MIESDMRNHILKMVIKVLNQMENQVGECQKYQIIDKFKMQIANQIKNQVTIELDKVK